MVPGMAALDGSERSARYRFPRSRGRDTDGKLPRADGAEPPAWKAEGRQFDPAPGHPAFTALTCANVELGLLHLVAASDRCYPLLTLGRRTLSHAGDHRTARGNEHVTGPRPLQHVSCDQALPGLLCLLPAAIGLALLLCAVRRWRRSEAFAATRHKPGPAAAGHVVACSEPGGEPQ